MFEHIAPRYDAFTRLFSFGMDARWKATLMAWFAERAPERAQVLDVACGTGDLALRAAALRPHGSVLGIDAADGMIALARARLDAGAGSERCASRPVTSPDFRSPMPRST